MKRVSKTATFLLNAFWRALYPLNIFLFLLLVFQIAAVFVIAFFNEFGIPNFLVKEIKDEVLKRGLVLNFNSARMRLSGEVSVKDASLRFVGTGEDFFLADKLYVSFWTMRLLDGELKLKQIRVAGGKLGPSYGDVRKKPAISGIYANIEKRGAWWHVSPLRFRFGNLGVQAGGVVNEDFSLSDILDLSALSNSIAEAAKSANISTPDEGDSDKDTREYIKVAKRLDRTFSDLSKAEKHLTVFGRPMLRIEFALFGIGENYMDVSFISGGAAMKILGKEIDVREFGGNFRLRSSAGKEDKISASIFVDEFSGASLPSFSELRARTDAVFAGDVYALRNFDITVDDFFYDGISVENISLRKRDVDKTNWKENWHAYVSSGYQRLAGTVSVDASNTVSASFSGTLDPGVVMSREELKDIPELHGFSFPTGINLIGRGTYNIDTHRINVFSDFEASDFVGMRIPIVSLSGRATYDSADGVLSAENLRVESFAGWRIGGTFRQNLKDYSYFIYLKGNIRPMDIAHFMEPWWTHIMHRMSFEGNSNYPKFDVSVEGKWGAPEHIWCFARVDGVNALYDDVMFESYGLYAWVNPARISLYDVSMQSGQGRGHAALEWLYGKDGITSFEKQTVSLVSTLSPQALIVLGGKDAKDVLDVVKFENGPNLTLNAVLYNPEQEDRPADIFNATAFARGNTVIETTTLKNARFSVKSDTVNTSIENASFGFCSGNATGNVRLTKTADGMLFSGDIFASKMNQAEFVNFLASIGGDDSAESGGDSLVEGGERGVVDLSIVLSGNMEKLEEIKGEGFIQLENKDLIRLNLFGMLSRALSAVGIPLASFDITYASSPFKIENGVVGLSKLEMGGAVMQIKGVTNYNFVTDNLDGAVLIIPFGGMTTPILSTVMSLVNPLASAIRVNLSGPIGDPNIGVSLSPLRILQSDERILENLRNSL